MISAFTCARKSIACISSVARAGVTPLSIVASCTGVTPVSASSAFIHICSSQAIAIGRKLVNTWLQNMVMIYKISQKEYVWHILINRWVFDWGIQYHLCRGQWKLVVLCCRSVVEHWWLKPEALGSIPSDSQLFTLLCFHLITSKYLFLAEATYLSIKICFNCPVCAVAKEHSLDHSSLSLLEFSS